jgi:hypothetical protein|tara:strand:+ start:715 stop:891 length:177 start_codon:yes stop_codon:yes gene_type:complete
MDNVFKDNVGYDICYGCGKSEEYGTMSDLDGIDGLDIYCDSCYEYYSKEVGYDTGSTL